MDNLFARAEALDALGRPDAALAEYDALVEDQLGYVEVFIHRGELLDRLDRPLEAEASFLQGAALSARLPWAHLRLAQMLHRRGRLFRAAEVLGEAVARQPSGEVLVVAAGIYKALAWLDLAARAVRALGAVEGYWAAVHAEVLLAHAEARREAIAALRSRQPRDALALATRLLELGRLRAAQRLCEAMMRERPTAFEPFALHARIVARREGPAAALAFLRAMRFLHGDSVAWRGALDDWEAQALG